MAGMTAETAALKDRISNLETALHGLYSMIKDSQPPETQVYMEEMMHKHFDASSNLGGFESAGFVG